MRNKEVCGDIPTKTIIAMAVCGAGVIGIVAVLGLAMLKAVVLSGNSALLLVMLMIHYSHVYRPYRCTEHTNTPNA